MTPVTAQTLLNRFVSAGLAIAPSLLGGVSNVVAVLINVAFVLFIAIFFLVDPFSYIKASLFLMPQRYHVRALAIWSQLYHTARTWISTLFLSISITMTLVWLILGCCWGCPTPVSWRYLRGWQPLCSTLAHFYPFR
jgi:predicted PurR-regulated permease PerM